MNWKQVLIIFLFLPGLSKFAKLARSVTRSRSVLASQFSSHIPVVKETSKQSNLAHVCFISFICTTDIFNYIIMIIASNSIFTSVSITYKSFLSLFPLFPRSLPIPDGSLHFLFSLRIRDWGKMIADDEPECRCLAAVSSRSTKDASSYTSPLLCLQGDMGLGNSLPDFLYSYNGALQRCL